MIVKPFAKEITMAQFTAASAFDSALIDLSEGVTNAKKRVSILRSNKARIQKILRPIALIVSGAGLKNVNAHVSADAYSDNFQIGVYLYGLESFKVPVLASLVEYLDGLCEDGLTRTREWPESLNRDYHFTLPKGHRVSLCVYVKDDSPTCRKVVIGKELKEVFKYEIQCD
jgi:hypothetical protein